MCRQIVSADCTLIRHKLFSDSSVEYKILNLITYAEETKMLNINLNK